MPILESTVFAIFGGGGDRLTWRKLMPALFNLYLDRSLPETFALLGLDRLDKNDEAFRQRLRDGVDQFSRRGPAKDAEWNAFAAHINYFQMDFANPTEDLASCRATGATGQRLEDPGDESFLSRRPTSFDWNHCLLARPSQSGAGPTPSTHSCGETYRARP